MINRHMPQKAGEVGILNVGDGDTKLTFDPKNPAERIRAARIVKDMIRRGYALLIEHPAGSGQYTRALDFKEDVCEYIIADFDPIAADKADAQEEQTHVDQQGQEGASAAPPAGASAQKQRRPYTRRNVAAGTAKAIAVAPSAGG